MDTAISPLVSRGDKAEFAIGFITALVTDELVSCEEVLASEGWMPAGWPELSDVGISRWEKSISDRTITAYSMAIGKMGQTAAGLETTAFLTRCQKPIATFMTGIAGSLWEEKVHKCDVVVSKNTRWRTQNKIYGEDGCDQYRPYDNPLEQPSVPSDLSRVIQRELIARHPTVPRSVSWNGEWNVHYGEIYTQDYVINSARMVRKINEQFPDSLCVEMEAGGFLSAIDRVRSMSGNKPMSGYWPAAGSVDSQLS